MPLNLPQIKGRSPSKYSQLRGISYKKSKTVKKMSESHLLGKTHLIKENLNLIWTKFKVGKKSTIFPLKFGLEILEGAYRKKIRANCS